MKNFIYEPCKGTACRVLKLIKFDLSVTSHFIQEVLPKVINWLLPQSENCRLFYLARTIREKPPSRRAARSGCRRNRIFRGSRPKRLVQDFPLRSIMVGV